MPADYQHLHACGPPQRCATGLVTLLNERDGNHLAPGGRASRRAAAEKRHEQDSRHCPGAALIAGNGIRRHQDGHEQVKKGQSGRRPLAIGSSMSTSMGLRGRLPGQSHLKVSYTMSWHVAALRPSGQGLVSVDGPATSTGLRGIPSVSSEFDVATNRIVHRRTRCSHFTLKGDITRMDYGSSPHPHLRVKALLASAWRIPPARGEETALAATVLRHAGLAMASRAAPSPG